MNALALIGALVSLQAFAAPPSPHLDFSLTPGQVEARCEAAEARALASLDELAALPEEKRSFEAFVRFDFIQSDLESETASPTFLKYVSADKAVRDAGHACETRIEKLLVDVYAREDLYRTLKDSAARAAADLTGADKLLAEKTLQDFRRNGLDLPPLERARYKLLKKRLVDMELTFGKNLNEVADSLAFAREELEGLPEDYIGRLERLPDGRYKVTLDYPDYFPFMSNAKSEDARRRLDALMKNRAYPENVALLEEILPLRLRLARMLGYPTHAHYVLEERMAKSPEEVSRFLKRMRRRLARKAKPELKEMLALKRRDDPGAKGFFSWDYFFYDNLLKRTRYEVDDEKVKEYFPMEKVTEGMLDLYQRLLGVRFRRVEPAEAWHDDVARYEAADAGSGEVYGHFYMDLHPREGKYKHAAAFTLIGGRREADGSYRAPVSAMVANFNKPGADRPSLLKHDEVETYFHEFGHIMHQVLTRADHPRFAGTRVARDFVEAPSQMLENWVWKKEVLKSLSGHYRTGETLPEELLQRMIEAKNLNSGLRYLRQSAYAAVDQAYHQARREDTTETYRKLYDEITLIPLAPGTHPQASFGHLMGYAASYYGYMWSEVFSADMFSRFEKEGVLDPALGRRYREVILEPGGGEEAGELLRRFLGRAPDETAFLKSIGL